MKYFLIIFFSLFLFMCKPMPIAEFPYSDYLGHWKDTISDIDWQFNQTEIQIDLIEYNFWKIKNDTLLMSNDINFIEKKYFVVKKPYLSSKYKWKMELSDTINYYLEKI